MKTFVCFAIAMGLLFAVAVHPVPAGNAPAEAEAMAKKAVDFYKANGKEKTIAALNDPKGEFIQGELYAFMFHYDFELFGAPRKSQACRKEFGRSQGPQRKIIHGGDGEKGKRRRGLGRLQMVKSGDQENSGQVHLRRTRGGGKLLHRLRHLQISIVWS